MVSTCLRMFQIFTDLLGRVVCDQWMPQVEAKVAKLSEVLELLLPGASEAICGVAWLIWAAAG